MDLRKYIIDTIISDPAKRILEIGPLNHPIIKKTEFSNCYYCDIRSTEQIKELYSGNDYLKTTGIHVDLSTIVDIDYVLDGSYENTFADTEKFDYVIASHVLEHMEDLMGFFDDINTVLKPNGRLCLLYPDKRYCFDHFREAASFRDAYDVYKRGRHEIARMALDFYGTAIAQNDPAVFWNGENMSSLMPVNDMEKAVLYYEKILDGKKLDDVHFWPFTDRGFLKFLYDCVRTKLLSFSCVDFHKTQKNTQEFMVILEYRREFFDEAEELENLKRRMAEIPEDYYNLKYAESVLIMEKVKELTAQNIKQKSELLEKSNQQVQLEEKIQSMQSHITYLRTIENSTIWKMSKPVRMVLDKVKNTFVKNRS